MDLEVDITTPSETDSIYTVNAVSLARPQAPQTPWQWLWERARQERQ